jgi:hypothetical protein
MAMLQKLVLYVLFFLIPGTMLLVFGGRMIDSNARSYPWAYPRLVKLLSLLLLYFIGVLLIIAGLLDFVLGYSPTW